jgi:hypothetical protein
MVYAGRIYTEDGRVAQFGVHVEIHGTTFEVIWTPHREAPPLCPRWDTRPDVTMAARGFGWSDTDRGKHWAVKRGSALHV